MIIIRVQTEHGFIRGYEFLEHGCWKHRISSHKLNVYELEYARKTGLMLFGYRKLCSMLADKNRHLIFDGDKIKSWYKDDNNEDKYSLFNVFFENGAFYVDESVKQDRSEAKLLNEYGILELA